MHAHTFRYATTHNTNDNPTNQIEYMWASQREQLLPLSTKEFSNFFLLKKKQNILKTFAHS